MSGEGSDAIQAGCAGRVPPFRLVPAVDLAGAVDHGDFYCEAEMPRDERAREGGDCRVVVGGLDVESVYHLLLCRLLGAEAVDLVEYGHVVAHCRAVGQVERESCGR